MPASADPTTAAEPDTAVQPAPLAAARSPRRVALVTGAAKRLGREIALDLARHGWDIALHYRHSVADAHDTAAALRELGVRVHLLQADLADEAACRALLPLAVAALDQVDAVVNSASTFEYDNAARFSYELLDKHMRANTAPAIVLAQALAEHVQGRASTHPTRGVVVNLLDQKLWNPNPDYLSYTLSKAALEAATTMLAMALAPVLRVCGVAPGVTLLSGEMNADEFAASHRMTPLGRSSTPADVARAVRFLLESPAVTGTTLLVDGGQHLQPQPRDVMFIARGA